MPGMLAGAAWHQVWLLMQLPGVVYLSSCPLGVSGHASQQQPSCQCINCGRSYGSLTQLLSYVGSLEWVERSSLLQVLLCG